MPVGLSNINLFGNNATYGLKLDPTEPGIERNVSEKELTPAVALQELGNLLGFKREAMLKGEDILYSDISFTRGFSGSTPVLFGGRTTVLISKEGQSQQIGYVPGQKLDIFA
jgi:hypothetical protein